MSEEGAAPPDAQPPWVEALLAKERAREGVPPELRAQIRAGVRDALSGAPAQPIRAPRPWKTASLAALAGVAVGAAGHALLSPRRPPPAPSAPAPAMSAPATTATATPPAAQTASVSAPPASALPSTRQPALPDRADLDLEAERTLVERARTAILRREPEAALDAVGLHERRFPRGRLSGEREVAAVRALTLAGRHDEARARVERFAASSPDSPLLSLMRRAVTKPSSSTEATDKTP